MSSQRARPFTMIRPLINWWLVNWWQGTGALFRLLVYIVGTVGLFLLLFWHQSSNDPEGSGVNLLAFFFVNLNILILCILVFVVGRNVTRLIFDRRKNILGSKLRSRLVAALVGITLVPTIFLFILASGLLNQAIEGWFNEQVDSAVESAVMVARRHFASIRDDVEQVASDVSRKVAYSSDATVKDLANLLEETRKSKEIFSIALYDRSGVQLVEVHNAAAVIESFREPPLDLSALKRAFTGKVVTLSESRNANQFIRSYLPVVLWGQQRAIVVTRRVDPELSEAFATVNDTYSSYGQLKLFRDPLKWNYVLTLGLVTGMILFAAMWLAFYIARHIVDPIEKLLQGTELVGKGEYEVHIPETGDDEVGTLIRSFNRMTKDLASSRNDAEARRLFVETIVNNLTVGVISLDREGRITTLNPTASKLFSIEGDVTNERFDKIMAPQEVTQIQPLIEEIENLPYSSVVERQITVCSHGRELTVVCTVGTIVDSSGERVGSLLLLDDITELSKAQQMSAWREVARRIAHEIKNPLTPIQLSAQRLIKVLDPDGVRPADASVIASECATTIVEHVGSIKRLANEFSNFARMPTAEFQNGDLNAIISDTISIFAERWDRLTVQFISEDQMPLIMIDSEQIRRVVMNLLENAAQAIVELGMDSHDGRIEIKTWYDRKKCIASFEVSDNGPGIDPQVRSRVFDPYFTTKKGGTGLGLAIVMTIITDHHGQIRVYENSPKGSKFMVELPAAQKTNIDGQASVGK